jgi:hypothetical protein
MKFIEKLFLKDLRLTGQIALYFFMGVALLVFLIHAFIDLSFGYPLDYGEGPLLNHALRITQGEPLYPTDLTSSPYLISNYPPVYVLLNALFVAIFGPSLLIGRLIAVLSTLGCAVLIGLIIRDCGENQPRLAILSGASIFLIMPYVLQWSTLFRIDMLALFFSLAGLYLVIKKPLKNSSIILAALFFILAAYTRQSFGLAGPLAALIWTWTKDKKQAIRLFLFYALGGIAIFGLLYWLTEGGFFFHIITANVNPFDWQRVIHFAREILRLMSWLIMIFLAFLTIGWRFFKSYIFLTPYILAAILAALTIGKIGSNVNYLVEVCAGLAILSGIVYGRLTHTIPIDPEKEPNLKFPKEELPEAEAVDTSTRRHLWINVLIFFVLSLILVIQIAELTQASLLGPITNSRNRIKRGNDHIFLEENIKNAADDGPILVDEFMGILPNNRIPLYLQPFEMTQLANAGLWDQIPLLQSIESQEFPLILIHHFQFFSVYQERWTAEMLDTIFNNYVAKDIKADSLFFEPKDFENGSYPDELACPQSPWQLPTRADMGMYWLNGQVLMMGGGRDDIIPVFAVADGLLYQFPEWNTAVAIQHDDPLNPGRKLWTFYGDLAPAFNQNEPYIEDKFIQAEGIPIKSGEFIGYQGRWLGPSQQTWVHLRFTILPADQEGNFPEVLLPIVDFNADLPSINEQQRLGLDAPISLNAYTGLPESNLFGVPDFLPFICETTGE